LSTAFNLSQKPNSNYFILHFRGATFQLKNILQLVSFFHTALIKKVTHINVESSYAYVSSIQLSSDAPEQNSDKKKKSNKENLSISSTSIIVLASMHARETISAKGNSKCSK